MDSETRDFLEGLSKRLDERFGQMDKRFESLSAEMGQRFDAVDGRFAGVEKRLGGLEQQVESLARLTASEFERAHDRLDEITDNTARAFGVVEDRL